MTLIGQWDWDGIKPIKHSPPVNDSVVAMVEGNQQYTKIIQET